MKKKSQGMKTMVLVAIAVLVVSPVIFWNDVKSMFVGEKEIMINDVSEPEVVQQWDLPAELVEISGLVYLSPGKFLCVQDEEGAVFTYNTATSTIENKILFGGPGDY